MTSKTAYQGKFTKADLLTFKDATGKERQWERVGRREGQNAVAIVATLQHHGEPHIVLVKQYRPPVDGYVIELPAGLVDGNESPAATAARELEEETGYVGDVTDEGPFACTSPGLTDEKTSIVCVSVKSQLRARPDDGEQIEVVLAPVRALKEWLRAETAKGTMVGAKLWSLAVGFDFGKDTGWTK